MTRFNAKAWLAWSAAAATVVLSIGDPLVTATAFVALAWVASTFARGGPEGRAYILLLKVGLAVTLIRVVLFSITGHTGPTTLFTLPVVGLPRWLGGFSVGGRVTAEVLAQEAAEGFAIAAFLMCFGVFVSVVETYRVLRLLPRFLFEAGLVVGIALSFVPTLLRTTSAVRDAQRLRGHRFRGLRSWRALVTPVLAGALERSISLAESMESRGYGRTTPGAHAVEARARVWLLGGLLGLAVGGGLALGGRGTGGIALSIAALAATAIGLRSLSRTVPRTAVRPERSTPWDRGLVLASAAIAAAALFLRRNADAHWYPYPAVHLPGIHPALIAVAAALVVPVPLAAARRAALRRASRPDASGEGVPGRGDASGEGVPGRGDASGEGVPGGAAISGGRAR
jgi:energy-coupling factor transport system permease protein